MVDDPLMFDDDEDFNEEPRPQKLSFAEIWANNPALKIFVVIAVIAVGITGYMMLGGGGGDAPTSRLGSASSVSDTPGQDNLSPAYIDQVEQQSKKRAEIAEKTEGSSIPTPVGKSDGRIDAPIDLDSDNLASFRNVDDAEAPTFNRRRGGQAGEKDTDGDGIPDSEDDDIDGDGIPNEQDDRINVADNGGQNGSSQTCLQQLNDAIDIYPSGFQSRYRRLFGQMSDAEHCQLNEAMNFLSRTGKQRLLGIMSIMSPDERRRTFGTLGALEDAKIETYVDVLNTLSRSDKGRLITLMSELADDLQNKLTDIMVDLDDAGKTRAINILEPMNDTDRRRTIELWGRLSPEELNALVERLDSMSPDQRMREINALSGLSDQQLQEAMRNLTQQQRNLPQLGDPSRAAEARNNRLNRANSLAGSSSQQLQMQGAGSLGLTVSQDYVDALAKKFLKQMGAVIDAQTPQPSTISSLGLTRTFTMPAVNQRRQASYLLPEQAEQQKSTRPYDESGSAPTASAEGDSGSGSSSSGGGVQTAQAQSRQGFSNNAFANFSADEDLSGILYNAGDIAYGQIITEANSDVPGPVLAYVASGPLAGGRAIGQFSVADEKLVLNFSLVVKDNKEYSINAIGLDPETTLPGIATDVDHHYFTRVILPGAARFVEGWSSAVVRQGTSVSVEGETVSTTQNDLDTGDELLAGFEEAAQEFADILDDASDDEEITVRIDAGTRIGLLFLERAMNNPQ